MLNRPIAFGFGSIRSGFGVWYVRNKSKKKKQKRRIFFIKQRHYWKTKSIQKLTRKATNTDSIFNIEYRIKKKKTKIKQTSRSVFLETKQIKEKKPISLCFPTFSLYPNTKQTQKIHPKSCIYLENIPKYGKTYFPLLSYIFSTPKHQAPSKHKKHILRIKKIVFSFFFFFG